MHRPAEDVPHRGALDQPSGVHDLDRVAELGDERDVVRDEDHRRAVFGDQLLHEAEHLSLRGDIERGRGLVGDHDVGLVGERDRDHDPLAHAARVLPRVVVEPRLRARDLDLAHELEDPLADVAAAELGLVTADRLADLRADGLHRIQRRRRILEDERDLATPHVLELPFAERDDIAAVQPDLTAGHATGGRDEPEQRHRQRRLPASGLADEAQLLAAAKVEADVTDGSDRALGRAVLRAQVADRRGPGRRGQATLDPLRTRGIDDTGEDVDDEAQHHVHDRAQQHEALNHRVVLDEDRLGDQVADAGPRRTASR